ncbi:uncharacterized protein N7529_008692 [Penicillium soppii]|uniref:uncharacterized protein n=1 Tax=Penicillium soppii TaxID=69789 RepID=UPI0025497840|nr:uncharacterized protein N7529_008692 [Penicillium soppii]KAJ5861382.1 hypothetical protein N7529_008692 [Penicillium soppii]
MAHGHYRHSRIGKLHNVRHRREIALNGEDSGSDLLKEVDPLQKPILPATDVLSDEDCDPQNSICLQNKMGESNALGKRDDTTSVTTIETVLQVVDASSHILLQSTVAGYPMTISDSSYGTFTISGSESPTATASLGVTISAEISSMTSPTLAPAVQPTISSLAETSLLTSSAISTQCTSNSTSQNPSSTRVSSTISTPVGTSTPLIASSNSTRAASVTSPQAHSYWSYSIPSSSSSTTSTASSTTSSTSSETYTTSSSGGFGISEQPPTATGTNSAPATSETQASGQGSSSNSDTSKIVGGVVGSVAGLALIIILLFYFLRRRGFFMGNKRHRAISDDAAAGTGAGALAGVGAGAGAGAREVAERRASNDPLFSASYFAPAFMKRWRQSTATMRTDSTIDSTSSERGFQKISGRKLPPVLTHGGDGFGGGLDGDSPTLPGFLPTSPGPGPIGSPSTHAPPPTSPYGMPLDSNYTREIEELNSPSRPNPVHLPVSSAVNVAHPITITPAHPIAQPQSAIPFIPPRPDGLGRSLHSYDGSRSSRFTEGIDM